MINCLDRGWCATKGAFSIPYWFVINGNDPFKWDHTNSPDPREWQRLVDEASQGPVIEIQSGGHGNRIVNTMHGASYFHLVIQKDHHEILDKFTKLAQIYSQIGCKFTVRYKQMTKPSLRVYRSPFCMYKIKGDIGNFDWFITTNKYSYLHYYSANETALMNTTKPRALYFVEHLIVQNQFNSFVNITRDYCGKIEFGLGNYMTSELLIKAGLSDNDIPLMLIHSNSQNCDLYYKRLLLDGQRLRYFDHIINNQTCESFKEGYIKKRDPSRILFYFIVIIGTAALAALFVEVRRLLISLKME